MKIIYNKRSDEHEGQFPEVQNRFRFIAKYLTKGTLKDMPDGEDFLHLGHSPEYIDAMKEASAKEKVFLENNFSKNTYDVAVQGVGASILGAETESFVLTRPPGHHAGYHLPPEEIGLGYCVFNNLAIATQYLVGQGKRVFVLDIDLHQGNGTQQILGNQKNIVVADIHQENCWPHYSNNFANCHNISLPKGTKDNAYCSALEEKVLPLIKEFNPDIIGVSAGFDGYEGDVACFDRSLYPSLERWLDEKKTYFQLTGKSFRKAKDIVEGYPYFAILEGGYHPRVVKKGIEAFVE